MFYLPWDGLYTLKSCLYLPKLDRLAYKDLLDKRRKWPVCPINAVKSLCKNQNDDPLSWLSSQVMTHNVIHIIIPQCRDINWNAATKAFHYLPCSGLRFTWSKSTGEISTKINPWFPSPKSTYVEVELLIIEYQLL